MFFKQKENHLTDYNIPTCDSSKYKNICNNWSQTILKLLNDDSTLSPYTLINHTVIGAKTAFLINDLIQKGITDYQILVNVIVKSSSVQRASFTEISQTEITHTKVLNLIPLFSLAIPFLMDPNNELKNIHQYAFFYCLHALNIYSTVFPNNSDEDPPFFPDNQLLISLLNSFSENATYDMNNLNFPKIGAFGYLEIVSQLFQPTDSLVYLMVEATINAIFSISIPHLNVNNFFQNIIDSSIEIEDFELDDSIPLILYARNFIPIDSLNQIPLKSNLFLLALGITGQMEQETKFDPSKFKSAHLALIYLLSVNVSSNNLISNIIDFLVSGNETLSISLVTLFLNNNIVKNIDIFFTSLLKQSAVNWIKIGPSYIKSLQKIGSVFEKLFNEMYSLFFKPFLSIILSHSTKEILLHSTNLKSSEEFNFIYSILLTTSNLAEQKMFSYDDLKIVLHQICLQHKKEMGKLLEEIIKNPSKKTDILSTILGCSFNEKKSPPLQSIRTFEPIIVEEKMFKKYLVDAILRIIYNHFRDKIDADVIEDYGYLHNSIEFGSTYQWEGQEFQKAISNSAFETLINIISIKKFDKEALLPYLINILNHPEFNQYFIKLFFIAIDFLPEEIILIIWTKIKKDSAALCSSWSPSDTYAFLSKVIELKEKGLIKEIFHTFFTLDETKYREVIYKTIASHFYTHPGIGNDLISAEIHLENVINCIISNLPDPKTISTECIKFARLLLSSIRSYEIKQCFQPNKEISPFISPEAIMKKLSSIDEPEDQMKIDDDNIIEYPLCEESNESKDCFYCKDCDKTCCISCVRCYHYYHQVEYLDKKVFKCQSSNGSNNTVSFRINPFFFIDNNALVKMFCDFIKKIPPPFFNLSTNQSILSCLKNLQPTSLGLFSTKLSDSFELYPISHSANSGNSIKVPAKCLAFYQKKFYFILYNNVISCYNSNNIKISETRPCNFTGNACIKCIHIESTNELRYFDSLQDENPFYVFHSNLSNLKWSTLFKNSIKVLSFTDSMVSIFYFSETGIYKGFSYFKIDSIINAEWVNSQMVIIGTRDSIIVLRENLPCFIWKSKNQISSLALNMHLQPKPSIFISFVDLDSIVMLPLFQTILTCASIKCRKIDVESTKNSYLSVSSDLNILFISPLNDQIRACDIRQFFIKKSTINFYKFTNPMPSRVFFQTILTPQNDTNDFGLVFSTMDSIVTFRLDISSSKGNYSTQTIPTYGFEGFPEGSYYLDQNWRLNHTILQSQNLNKQVSHFDEILLINEKPSRKNPILKDTKNANSFSAWFNTKNSNEKVAKVVFESNNSTFTANVGGVQHNAVNHSYSLSISPSYYNSLKPIPIELSVQNPSYKTFYYKKSAEKQLNLEAYINATNREDKWFFLAKKPRDAPLSNTSKNPQNTSADDSIFRLFVEKMRRGADDKTILGLLETMYAVPYRANFCRAALFRIVTGDIDELVAKAIANNYAKMSKEGKLLAWRDFSLLKPEIQKSLRPILVNEEVNPLEYQVNPFSFADAFSL